MGAKVKDLWSLATEGTQEPSTRLAPIPDYRRLPVAFLCRDSAIQASLMALAAPSVLILRHQVGIDRLADGIDSYLHLLTSE